jgi:hypothetical protein
MSIDQSMDLRAAVLLNLISNTADQAVANAVPGRKLRILQIELSATAAGIVTFNSKGAGAGTACTIPYQVPANTVVVIPAENFGHGETNSGEALTATTNTVVGGVNVRLVYAVV